MTGDGESQPVESVDSLDDLANALAPETKAPVDEAQRTAPESDEADEDEQEVEDTEESDDEAEDDAEEPTFTIKVDGKDVTLKQSELVELGQKGLDYTKKTMAVAEERKAVEAEREQVTERRKHVESTLQETMTRLQAFTTFMETQVGSPPDVALLEYDTAAYLKAEKQYEARKGQLQQAYAAQQQVQQEQSRQRHDWIQQKAAATEQALKDTLPSWSDDTLAALADYAGKLGLNTQTADMAMLEPGFWQLAHKAQAYDAIQARKAQMKPTEKLAKVIKPTANNTTGKVAERAKREAAFNKNPSVDALAELLR
jgi:hypothetical protein